MTLPVPLANGPLTLDSLNKAINDLNAAIASGGGGGGSGNVTGPNSSTSGNLAVFGDASGKVIADGGAPVTSLAGLSDVIEDVHNNLYLGETAGGVYVSGAGGNTGVGIDALNGITTGSENVAIGWGSGSSMLSGSSNVIIGEGAGGTLDVGFSNILIGKSADVYANIAQGTIQIGYHAIAPADYTIQLGSSGTSFTDVHFGDDTAQLHGNGTVQTPTITLTSSTPTAIDGTQYLTVTINGTAYNLAIVTPGT